MAEGVTRKLIESLKCSICLDTYNDPKTLPCTHGHVYCQKCLENLVKQDQQRNLYLTCPMCRQAAPIPTSGIAGLQADFRTNFLLEMVGELRKEVADIETLPPCEYCIRIGKSNSSVSSAMSWSATSVLSVVQSIMATTAEISVSPFRDTEKELLYSCSRWKRR